MIGVYLLIRDNKVIYVGRTTQWPQRITAHKDLNFTKATLFECPEDKLVEYEARFIRFFNPKYNISASKKKAKHKRVTDDWVRANADAIHKAALSNKIKAITDKARIDLGFARMSSSSGMFRTMVSDYERINNLKLIEKRGKYQFIEIEKV
jgi:hypothetical protein